MIDVSATIAANEFHRLLDRVEHGEIVLIRKHGRARAELRRKVGCSKAELLERFKNVRFTETEQQELTAAMKAANDFFHDGHRA